MPGFPWDPHTWRGLRGTALCPAGERRGWRRNPGSLGSSHLALHPQMGEKSGNNFQDQCLLLVPRGASQARAERNRCFFFAGTKRQNKSSASGNDHFYVGLVVADLKQTTSTHMWGGLLIWEIVYLPETLQVWYIKIKLAQYDIKSPQN